MKAGLLLFVIGVLLGAGTASFAQQNKDLGKKSAVFLEFYQPIQTPSLREFYNDEWILKPSNEYKRHYFSNSFGMGCERAFKNNMVIRPRVGMTFRKLSERSFTDKFNTGLQDVTFEEQYEYNQKHLNFFLGIGRRTPLTEHLSLDFGVDLCSVHYLNGNTTYYSIYTYYLPGTSDYIGQDEFWWTNKVGRAFGLGAGPFVKPEFILAGNISISAELQMYFLYSGSKDKTTTSSRQRVYYVPASPIGEYLFEYSASSETAYDFAQWTWSRLSPLIRIGYKF